MKKRILSTFLTFCMMLSLLPMAALAASQATLTPKSTFIPTGATDPTVILTSDKAFDTTNGIDSSNYTINADTTGLTVGTIELDSSDSANKTVKIPFTGTAAEGTLSITVKKEAFASSEGVTADSDAVTITVPAAPVNPIDRLTVTIAATDSYNSTVSVSGQSSGTVNYAKVTGDPTAVIATWTKDTAESQVLADLSLTNWWTLATLTYADNDLYVVAVEIDGGKVTAAGFAQVSGIESAYTFDESNIGTPTDGGAGVSQTVSFESSGVAFTGNEYVVVQVTTGTGADTTNTLVMFKIPVGSSEVTCSYDKDAVAVKLWITSGLPNVTGGGSGVASFDTIDLK